MEHDEHYTLQDHETPISLTNSPTCKQPAKQSHMLVSTTTTVKKTPSGLKPNDAKITPMIQLPRPSTATTTKDSIIEIDLKPVGMTSYVFGPNPYIFKYVIHYSYYVYILFVCIMYIFYLYF